MRIVYSHFSPGHKDSMILRMTTYHALRWVNNDSYIIKYHYIQLDYII